MAAKRKRKAVWQQAPAREPVSSKAKRFLKSIGRVIRRIPWGINVLTVLLVLFGIYQARVTLIPVVQPDSAITPSWEDLPIMVSNTSDLFDFKDAQFVCFVRDIRWKDVPPSPFPQPPFLLIRRPPETIMRGRSITTACSISKNARTTNGKGEAVPLAWVRLRIITSYRINFGLFSWHRIATSQEFTWREVPGGFQWLPGDTSIIK